MSALPVLSNLVNSVIKFIGLADKRNGQEEL